MSFQLSVISQQSTFVCLYTIIDTDACNAEERGIANRVVNDLTNVDGGTIEIMKNNSTKSTNSAGGVVKKSNKNNH